MARYYGLERGEIGSSKKHTTKYQWHKQKQEQELAEKAAALTQATAQIEEADKMLQDKRYRLTAVEVELYGTEREKRIAEEQREKAEEETRELTSQKEKLCKEIAPLSAAAEAFTKASGKKPDKKQIPALVAENARLAKELEYSIKDQTGLFSELQKAERENASLKKDAQTYRTIREHAPDKLAEAMDEAKRRKENKHAPFRGNSSSWTK